MEVNIVSDHQVNKLPIPHASPFLFVDRELERGENYLLAEKYFSGKEPLFTGHFPGMPILPGVIQLEAQFQTASLFLSHLLADVKPSNSTSKQIPAVTKIGRTRFKQFIAPPASLIIRVELMNRVQDLFEFKGSIRTKEGKLVCSSEFHCTLVKKEPIQ